uniref:ANF_receptor domain-containing protein n=1 Tax=Macrostomum lignano TaxID=282301 RepID=A0A1I8IWN7_9PLAT
MQQGVLAVVGPPSPVASQQVRSVCEHLAVPFIETAWHHRGGGGGGGLEGDNEGPYSVNLNPDYRTFGRAILDYVRAIGDWDLAKNEGSHGGVAIVYKDPDTLLKFEPLLNAVQVPVLLRQWRRQAGTFQYVMKELRSAKVYKILVDIPTSEILRFVSIAKLMNMTTTYHSYIFTSWDAQRIDLSKYQLIKSANMSNERYNVSQRVENMREEIFNVQSRRGNYSGNLTNMLPTQAATLFDSLILLAHGLERMANARSIQVQPLKCSAPRQNARGATLLNYMRSMTSESGFATLTGPVEFDAQWRRSNFTLVAYELTRAGFN